MMYCVKNVRLTSLCLPVIECQQQGAWVASRVEVQRCNVPKAVAALLVVVLLLPPRLRLDLRPVRDVSTLIRPRIALVPSPAAEATAAVPPALVVYGGCTTRVDRGRRPAHAVAGLGTRPASTAAAGIAAAPAALVITVPCHEHMRQGVLAAAWLRLPQIPLFLQVAVAYAYPYPYPCPCFYTGDGVCAMLLLLLLVLAVAQGLALLLAP